jgi:hypothetical protein
VYDCTFDNGQAQNGTFLVNGKGGAIANFGDLVVGSSKFTRNQAIVAGAVLNNGTADINCSTFENNGRSQAPAAVPLSNYFVSRCWFESCTR